MTLARTSIGARIFGAFIAMSAMIGLLGMAGYAILSKAGVIAMATFDGPLQAISYARAAHFDFTEMQLAELRFEQASPQQRSLFAEQIADRYASFNEDLGVAAERSPAADEQKLIAEIKPLVKHWRQVRTRGDAAELAKLDSEIDAKFDLLIEYNTDHTYVGRRQTGTDIANYKYAVGGFTLLALLLAGLITWLLRSRIVRPLTAAARVADRIAKGDMQTEIPQGGGDETGALLKSMTVMQDNIRQMMARETAMRLSAENRLTDALETSTEGVMLVAPGGEIVLANSSLRRFFSGLAAMLVPGTTFKTALAAIQTQLAPGGEGKIETSGHAELQLADGRWLRLTGSATSEGGTIIFFSDFTVIKEREEGYRKAREEAEAANAAKTRFLANMSHELRTPLNAIIGFSEIISGELFGALGNEKYLDYSGDILRSGRHLLAVINDVLDLVKSESGRMSLRARDLDMREVLEDCAAMMAEQCRGARLTFTVTAPQQPLTVRGDPAKLRQIFLNLLSNAVKFTESGGTVTLAAEDTEDQVRVIVADNGIGMSAEDIAIALQPFGQVDNRLERRYEGTGLGLPLTKALLDLHGAGMVIDSERGRGTAITLTFPKAGTVALAEAV
ncbi:MAG: HAMP domain-containing protein [Alphaproteobacteria bacterium]|nr:HAMP domain-containing protein [Alphaproteobacteria bacterium]